MGGDARTGLLLPSPSEGWQVQAQLEAVVRPELMLELEVEVWVAPKLKESTIIGLEPLGQSVRLEHWVVAVQTLDVVDIELLIRGLG